MNNEQPTYIAAANLLRTCASKTIYAARDTWAAGTREGKPQTDLDAITACAKQMQNACKLLDALSLYATPIE